MRIQMAVFNRMGTTKDGFSNFIFLWSIRPVTMFARERQAPAWRVTETKVQAPLHAPGWSLALPGRKHYADLSH